MNRRLDSPHRTALPKRLRSVLAGVLILVLVVASSPPLPLVVSITFAKLLGDTDGQVTLGDSVTAIVAALAVLTITTVAAWGINHRLTQWCEARLERLRARVFAWGQRCGGQQETRRAVDDVEQVSEFLRWGVPPLIARACQLALTCTVMLACSWMLALVAGLAFLPTLTGGRLASGAGSGGATGSGDTADGRTTRWITEWSHPTASRSDGPVTVFSENDLARQELLDRLDRETMVRDLAAVRTAQAEASELVYSELATGVAAAAVTLAGVTLGVAGAITLAKLSVFLVAFSLAVPSARAVSSGIRDARRAAARWRQLVDLDPPLVAWPIG